ncbi:MAG TPA: hypothetical protein VFV39_08320 [Limnobacter sp.]|nr:hypothetical protein [Limnobacter sp.]
MTLRQFASMLCGLVFACALPTSAKANGFEDFDDAELIDKIAGSVGRGYARMHGYTVEFKLIGHQTPHASAILAQYDPARKRCTFFISTQDATWHSFEQYLIFFEGLPKQVVYEAFFAHESGHCVQGHESIDFGPVNRRHRQELFADVFALSHVERYFPKHRPAFQQGQYLMRRAAAGMQPDYDFSRELRRLSVAPALLAALKIKDPRERAFSIAKAVDML